MTTLQDRITEQTYAERGLNLQPCGSEPCEVNVSEMERWVSGLGGGLLLVAGLGRGGLGGLALAGLGGAMLHRAVTGYCHTYQLLGIDTAHQGSSTPHDFFDHGIHVEQSFTINRPAEELYRFWKDFENLPSFMRHLKRVEVIDDRRSHWVAQGPAGREVQWDARIIREEPDRLIAWRSEDGADVDNAGSIRFVPAPAGRGTQVKVTLDYIPPAGRIGFAVAKLFGEEPRQQIEEDLRLFKQLMEAGEVASTAGQPVGASQM